MELLREYDGQGSEEAFAELVRRQIDLVYSAAFRHVGIAAHAEEITQAVFVTLARKAASLRPDTILEGWLYETARLTALSFRRGERRRHFREQEAYMQSRLQESTDASTWDQLAPLLDEAMSRLKENDRDAVVLRFFKGKNLLEAAAAMHVTESAAQSRVHRAVEKLRVFFKKRGIIVPAAVLTAAISANSVQVAPIGLAQKIVATVSTMTGTVVVSTFIATTLGKVLAVCGSVAVVAVTAAIYFQLAGESSNGKVHLKSSQSALMSSNQTSPIPLQSSLNVSNTRPIPGEDSKLDEAIAHLREVLHTRPTTHEIYDSAKITNAIEAFGLYRRDALNVLLDNTTDPEEFVRDGSISGMGYLGKYLPEVPAILWNMIYSTTNSYDHWIIFQALKRTGFAASDLAALTGLLTNDPICNGSILTELVPQAVASLIEANPQGTKPYLFSVESLLDDSDPDVRFRAALSLIKSEGTNNPKIFSSLHELFQRPNNRSSEYYKYLAAEVLRDDGPAAQPLVPDLLGFAKTAREIGVQEAVYRSVAKIKPDLGSKNDDVAKALKEQEDASMWQEKWKSGTYSFDDLRAALKDQAQTLTAANHLAEMGTNAIEAVPDMIKALWGRDEDTRNKILEDIHKVDPQVVVTKISMTKIITGNLHEFLDKQPPTQQNKMLQQDVVTLELFSGWCLPEELSDFTNKLAQQNQDAYTVFVNSQPH
ncbi:MAG TPA: sigma-70 family RNA polymerase sigma factor [Candidatus Acidoferrum sp.]|nr:sigma-70 family RNA polymerase sigma factor [Candidatus Acidoferrum sp.]